MDFTPTNRKYIFQSIKEAKAALKMDKLGTVYIKLDNVFVATSHGTGTFNRKEWEKFNE